MANEPPPPLPFGSSANLPKSVAGFSEQELNQGLTDGNRFITARAGIQDVTSLIGERLFERLEVRGEIGSTSVYTNALQDQVNRVRQPWVLTCQKWIDENRYLICRVNPKDVQWRMPQRSVEQKTRIGTVLHIWRDRFRGTFYDEPTISINFQAGNIMPIRQNTYVSSDEKQTLFKLDDTIPQSYTVRDPKGDPVAKVNNPSLSGGAVTRQKPKPDPTETPTVPPGLDNFYEFIQLVDEQKILDDGRINYCYIMYNSRIFPNLTLAGLFTPDGVSWADSSDDPNTVQNWSANFTIYDSYPRLHDIGTLRKFFETAGFGRV